MQNRQNTAPTRNAPARSRYGEPLGVLSSPRRARGLLRYAAPALGRGAAPWRLSLALACYGGSGRVALRSRPAGLAARRPSRRLRRAPPLAGSPLRLRQGACPLRGAFGALACGSVARWRRGSPAAPFPLRSSPRGGSRPSLWSGLGGCVPRPPSECSAPAGAVWRSVLCCRLYASPQDKPALMRSAPRGCCGVGGAAYRG